MRRAAPIVMMCLMLALGSAHAIDRGQFENVPDDIRAWFKSKISPSGVPCCDISDGFRTEYDVRDGAYWVPIEGMWWQGPARAGIRDGGNPVGEGGGGGGHHLGPNVIH